MIEAFWIDVNRGYPDQVCLFIKAEDRLAEGFRQLLARRGFSCWRFYPSREPGFSHAAYVSLPREQLDKAGIRERLTAVCQEQRSNDQSLHEAPVSHTAWRTALDQYVREYRAQQLGQPAGASAATFDRGRAYSLIQAGRHEEAERYLSGFATDSPPALVPHYLIYLYHEWRRPAEIAAAHGRYADQLRAGDVDRRVIEWVAQGYLEMSPASPEQALSVLDEFLPEFQRLGVADRLLALRSQARALLSQLPQTAESLEQLVAGSPDQLLRDRLDEIIDVAAGLAAPAERRLRILDGIVARLGESARGRVALRSAEIARHADDLPRSLEILRQLAAAPAPDLDERAAAGLPLDIAGLHILLGQHDRAVEALGGVSLGELSAADQQSYWALLGRAQVQLGHTAEALDALRQAHELGAGSPDVLGSLGRLAARAGDWSLAQRAYTGLLQSGVEPTAEDQLYTGILAWLNDDFSHAIELLRPALEMISLSSPSATLMQAYEALSLSLIRTSAPVGDLLAAFSQWGDTLVAHGANDSLPRFIKRILETRFDNQTTFTLLESIEPSVWNSGEQRSQLAEAYKGILFQEIAVNVPKSRALPEYVLALRASLLSLDQALFDSAQQYLSAMLEQARAAELVSSDFSPEPAELAALDLSGRWVALIGGYSQVRRGVAETLAREHRLGRFTEVAPSWEEHIDQERVADAVRGADLIVVAHRCMKHDGTDALRSVVEGTELAERVRYAAGKGQSSIVRAVREYFGQDHA